MIKIVKKNLIFKKTLPYFKETINSGNALSDGVLELVCFDRGEFYGYYPEDAPEDKIYDFQYSYTPSASVSDFVYSSIYKLVKNNSANICIFDDFNCNRETVSEYDFFEAYGRYINQEIYYILDNSSSTIPNIEQAYNDSDTLWHSLGIISETNVSNGTNKELSAEEVKNICLNAKHIFVTAYDGEGCVFWKRNENDK